MSEWREVALGDVIELKRGYDLPTAHRREGSVPIVSSSGPTGFHDEAKVSGPGVVTGRYGTLGEVFYIEEDFWPLNTALYVRDFKGNHPRFVAALLSTLDLGRRGGAAAVPGVNRNHLHVLPVTIPDPATQVRIGEVLKALDDLIETNRRRIALLEQMAQAIYREWFVHFRYPGHEDDQLVDSPLGPIPASWDVAKLGDFVEEIRNAAKPSAETAVLAYVPIDSITPTSLTLREHRPGSEAASSLRLFRKGDILFGAMRAYFHKVCIAPFDGVTRSTVFVLRPDPGYYHYLALLLSDEATVSYAAAHSSGSTIPYAKWAGGLREMTALRPTPDLAERFGLGVAPMIEMAEVLAQSITTLITVRDSLLPKLVTGAVDVSSFDLNAHLEEPAA